MSNGGSTSGKGGASAQQYGANPYNNAAQGMTQAFNAMSGLGQQVAQQGATPNLATAATAAAVPGVQGQQAQAMNMQAAAYNPAMAQAAQANAHQTQGANYNAAMQSGPQTIASQMGTYQNPYEDQVVQSTTDQVMRALQQTQMGNGDAAIAAGAFGGGRHGLVEATTNAEALRNIGDLTGQLRSQGFNTAAGLAGQDIANTMSVNAQNQAALNTQRQFGAGNQMQANLANQAALNNNSQFNAANQQQMNLSNQAATNQAGQYNAGNRQQANSQNAQLQTQNNQFNAGQRQNALQQNQQLANMLNQFNAGQLQQNSQFNAGQRDAAGNAYVNNAQNIANGLANLGQVSFGMGNSLTQQQQQQGGMAQQLMQQILSGGQQGFQDLVSSPERLLQLRLASLGMNPLNNATTTTGTTQNNVGSGVGLGNLLGAAGNMFSFAPITLSSARFKHDIQPTGRKVRSQSGRVVDEVRFKYLPHIDPSQTCNTGVIAESLGDDPAVFMYEGRATAVDYSKLEVV